MRNVFLEFLRFVLVSNSWSVPRGVIYNYLSLFFFSNILFRYQRECCLQLVSVCVIAYTDDATNKIIVFRIIEKFAR